VLFALVVLGLVSSVVLRQEIGAEERLYKWRTVCVIMGLSQSTSPSERLFTALLDDVRGLHVAVAVNTVKLVG